MSSLKSLPDTFYWPPSAFSPSAPASSPPSSSSSPNSTSLPLFSTSSPIITVTAPPHLSADFLLLPFICSHLLSSLPVFLLSPSSTPTHWNYLLRKYSSQNCEGKIFHSEHIQWVETWPQWMKKDNHSTKGEEGKEKESESESELRKEMEKWMGIRNIPSNNDNNDEKSIDNDENNSYTEEVFQRILSAIKSYSPSPSSSSSFPVGVSGGCLIIDDILSFLTVFPYCYSSPHSFFSLMQNIIQLCETYHITLLVVGRDETNINTSQSISFPSLLHPSSPSPSLSLSLDLRYYYYLLSLSHQHIDIVPSSSSVHYGYLYVHHVICGGDVAMEPLAFQYLVTDTQCKIGEKGGRMMME